MDTPVQFVVDIYTWWNRVLPPNVCPGLIIIPLCAQVSMYYVKHRGAGTTGRLTGVQESQYRHVFMVLQSNIGAGLFGELCSLFSDW